MSAAQIFRFNTDQEADAFMKGVQASVCDGESCPSIDVIRYLDSHTDHDNVTEQDIVRYELVLEVHKAGS